MKKNLEDFGNRVKKKRNALGLSQEELAYRLGYKTKGSIARIEKGERDLPIDKLKPLANALKTTPAYLMGWEDNTTYNNTKQTNELCLLDNDNTTLIPLYSGIAAGPGFEDVELEEMIPVFNLKNPDNCFAIRVNGDSMEPRVPNGCIAIIRANEEIRNGNIGAFEVNSKTFLKQKLIKKNKLILHSINLSYDDMLISEFDDYREIGRVVQIIVDDF